VQGFSQSDSSNSFRFAAELVCYLLNRLAVVSQWENSSMTLQACRECGNEVSDAAVSCPRCGAPRPAIRDWTGTGFEWKSRATIFGIPLIHIAFGRNSSGRLRVAKGVIAVGQFAVGLFTVAQFGIGIIFGFGQFMIGLTALAQFAGGILIGVGQVATGVVTAGQFVVGIYGLAQAGWARYMWSPTRVDMEAVALYSTIQLRIEQLLAL
jgi:hypothetical protein